MSYRSDVALIISANVNLPTYMVDDEEMINGDDDGEPYWFLDEFLSITEPDEWHRRDGDYYFFWNQTKWYDMSDERNYVNQLTSNLSNNDIDYGYIIIGEDVGDIYVEGCPSMYDVYAVTYIEKPDGDWDPEPTETPRPFNEEDPFGEERIPKNYGLSYEELTIEKLNKADAFADEHKDEQHTLEDWLTLSGIDINNPIVQKAIKEG